MLSTVRTPTEKTPFSSLALRKARAFFVLAGISAFAMPLVPQAKAQAVGKPATAPAGPCCEIKSINAHTEIVTAVEKATRRSFQFSVKDQVPLKSLHLGQSVSADFNTSQATMYGLGPSCQITSSGVTSEAGTLPGSGGGPGGAKSQSQAAASGKAALATAESHLLGIRMEIQELKRSGNAVSLKFTLFNDGSQPFALGYSLGGWNTISTSYLIDPLTNTKYTTTACSAGVPAIAPKSKAMLWAKFAVPPEMKRATVVIPRFVPLENVPISMGP